MDDTAGISNITYKVAQPGLRVVSCGSEVIGVIRGNYATGFWAYMNDSTQILGTYASPHEAAEVLALEVSLAAAVF